MVRFASIVHTPVWTDQAECSTADVKLRELWDPSALLEITFAGAPQAGDVESLTFSTANLSATAPYTVHAGDSLDKIGACLADASIAGCAGTGNVGILQLPELYAPSPTPPFGQVLYIGNPGAGATTANPIALDWNAANPMWVSFTSTADG